MLKTLYKRMLKSYIKLQSNGPISVHTNICTGNKKLLGFIKTQCISVLKLTIPIFIFPW